MRIPFLSICCGFLFLGVTAEFAVATPVEYLVTVNTTSIAAQSGYIDMQFTPSALAGGQSATANVTNILTNGLYNPHPADPFNGTTGDVTVGSGNPPSSIKFDNGQTLNEYTEDQTFGTSLSFDLTLDGGMIETPNGKGGATTFYLDFINSAQSGYLLTNDPNGSTANGFYVGYVTVNPNGTTSITQNSGPGGGPSEVTFALVKTAVPEPATLMLLSGALIGVGGFVRRRQS